MTRKHERRVRINHWYDTVFVVGKTGSDYYFRKLLERWRREELGRPLSREEKQALVDWDKTSSDLRAQLKHDIAEAGPEAEPAA